MNLMEWFAGDEKNAALFRERVQKAITNGFADLETQLTLPDGSRPWYYFTAVPLEIAGKKYFTGIGINVSARKEAEKKIAENRQQLEEIAATIPGVVYQFHARKDGSRYISYYGGRVKEIFGAPESVDDFFAWFTEHVHPDDRQAFTESVDAALLGHSIWQYEGRFVKPTGETVWFQGQAARSGTGTNRSTPACSWIPRRRKTPKLALSESEEKYRLIAENSPDNIVFIDPECCFRYLNAPAAALFNATPGELAGKHINDLFGGGAEERTDLLNKVMESRAPVVMEVVADLPAGKRWLDVRLMPVIDNGKTIRGVLGITRDITEQKRMEDAIRETTKKLHLLSGITRHDVSNQLTVMEGLPQARPRQKTRPHCPGFPGKSPGIDPGPCQHQLGFMRTYQELGIKAPAWHRIADLVAAA